MPEKMETELKPCPFCGSIRVHLSWSYDRHAIDCDECPAGVVDYTKNKEQLILAWNNRAVC